MTVRWEPEEEDVMLSYLDHRTRSLLQLLMNERINFNTISDLKKLEESGVRMFDCGEDDDMWWGGVAWNLDGTTAVT
jgi:hypothetical protein